MTLFFADGVIADSQVKVMMRVMKRYKCLWVSPGLDVPCNFLFQSQKSLRSHMLNVHLLNLQEPYICFWQTCAENSQDNAAFKTGKSLEDHIRIDHILKEG